MKITLADLNAAVSAMLDATTIAGSFSNVADTLSNLAMKCAKMVVNESQFSQGIDDYFDGDDLPVGGYIEEYFQHMIAPISYDPTGANTLSPHYPEYAPTSYSFPIAALNFPMTINKVEYKQFFTSVEGAARFMSLRLKAHSDAQRIYRSEKKKALLGYFAYRAIEAVEQATTFVASTAYAAGLYLKDSSGNYGIVINAIAAADALTTLAAAIAGGYVAKLDIVQEIAKPVDTATGEAFIKQVKIDAEKAKRPAQSNNLAGAIIQPEEGNLLLVLKEEIMPSLEVDTYAGAFHRDDLDTGLKQIVVDNVGDWTTTASTDVNAKVLGIMLDQRGVKLHLDQVTSDEQLNAEGHFYTIYTYSKFVPYISPFTFVKVYIEQ